MPDFARVPREVDVLVMQIVPIPAPPIGATTVTVEGEELPIPAAAPGP
jgi:hypothetical protein